MASVSAGNSVSAIVIVEGYVARTHNAEAGKFLFESSFVTFYLGSAQRKGDAPKWTESVQKLSETEPRVPEIYQKSIKNCS